MIKNPLVCIDPGHGGKDPGAVGPGGLRESDVVISVGDWLHDYLMDAGVKVVMTRESDKYVALGRRAEIANNARADVFLSIHCNSAKNPAWGIETWIARQTAVSYPLAEKLQDAMTAAFPKSPDRGVKRENFTVLKNTRMAAALVELEFIHTPCGEELLASRANQRKYAEALFAGLSHQLGIETPAHVTDVHDRAEPEIHSALDVVSALDPLVERMTATLDKFRKEVL